MANSSLGANWPDYLPSCETSTKSRTQPEGFKFSDVNAGPPFLEVFSEDLPTFWDITFKFTRDQARVFAIWLSVNNMRTESPWFEFPIQMEQGLTTQLVRFMSYPQCTGQIGNVFSYSASIMTRELATNCDEECPEGVIYIIENKSCNKTFDKAATCFGEAFDDGWPA